MSSSSSARVAVRLLGPRIPLMLKTTLLHLLSLSPTSSKWDLRLNLIITVLRSIMEGSTASLTRTQRFTLRDPGIKGPIWVAPTTFAAPSSPGVEELLFKAIDEMKTHEKETYTRCKALPVEGEWTGYRKNAGKSPKPLSISPKETYERLIADTTSKTTVLYFHGGGYCMMDPCSHRDINRHLAKLTGGKTFSVRYRLAPQNPFPAALLDCLVAYLSLIYPPEGSLHSAVEARDIFFAGDSAGGNASLVLLLVLLHLHRTAKAANKSAPTVSFHGRDVEIPLPGGVTSCSPWCDLTRVLACRSKNAKWDYLPMKLANFDKDAPKDPAFPYLCDLWPANPPRVDIYCDGSALCHPLVSPLRATKEQWEGAPPMYFFCGEEVLSDECRVVVRRCHQAGVDVRFEAYEAMPHVFMPFMEGSKLSARAYAGWTNWINTVAAENHGADSKMYLNGGVWIKAKSLSEIPLNLTDELSDLTDEEVDRLTDEERERRARVFQEYQDYLQSTKSNAANGTVPAKL